MPPYKVLVLAPYLTVEQAGAAQSTITILQALSRTGWANVTVAAFTWDERLIPSNIRRVRMREETWPAPAWRLFPLPDYWHALRGLRALRLGDYDLCYTQNIALGLAYRRVYPDVPIASHPGAILWDREVLEESGAPRRWRRVQARIARWLERRSYREPRWRHFASSRLVADIRCASFGLEASTFEVAPLPIDPTRFDPSAIKRDVRQELGLSREHFVVVTVARLVPWKRVDAVIRAVAPLTQKVVLLVVGDGPERPRLEALASSLGVSDRVRFVGRQDPPPFLAAADLFVLPSLIESLGLVYLEAMMMGLPCIALRYRPPAVLSAASEVVTDGEFGFCVNNDEELRRRIESLAATPELCRQLGRRARETALGRYTPDKYIDRLRALLRTTRSTTVEVR